MLTVTEKNKRKQKKNPSALHTEGLAFEPQRNHISQMAPPVAANIKSHDISLCANVILLEPIIN